ncbi:Amino acid transporter 1 [Colletotrichum viniferum]|nr:Amino acid transporter 1 [Colletotrichum viniferum]
MEVKTQEDVEVGRRDNESTGKTSMVDIDHGADSQLQRRLGNRHITMIGIGSSIGKGLWLGSGKGLVAGGHAPLFIRYEYFCDVLSEYPPQATKTPVIIASSMTNKFVDPAAGFALGWCYWFNYWIAVANELQGIITVVIALINVGAVTVFAEVEVVIAAIKLGWILVVIIASIFYLAVWSFNGETSAKSFFSTYVSVPVDIIIYIAAKFLYGDGRWLDSRSIDLVSDRRFYSAEQEKEDKKVPFAKRILKKLLLQLINLLVLLPALVSAAHGDPRRMSYSGSCIIAKDGTWSPKCTTAYVEAALGSQCTNLGGTLSNINFHTTIMQINYRCNCVHGNTKDFTFNDGVFEARAVVGDKC